MPCDFRFDTREVLYVMESGLRRAQVADSTVNHSPLSKEPSWREKRAVGRSSSGSTMQFWIAKVTDLEDAECQGRRTMEMTKGRLAEWFSEPDLLHRVTLRSTFLATINTFLNI
uniref:Uncharacterized protein n=1 Tax=Solanum tuberosum TaxID=4113 RepID=M1D9T3_SOLTU